MNFWHDTTKIGVSSRTSQNTLDQIFMIGGHMDGDYKSNVYFAILWDVAMVTN